jgi:hypothetical protein
LVTPKWELLFNKLASEASLLKKNPFLAPAFGATKLIPVTGMISVWTKPNNHFRRNMSYYRKYKSKNKLTICQTGKMSI